MTGLELYDTLNTNAPPPANVTVTPVPIQDQADRAGDAPPKFTDIPTPARTTAMSIIIHEAGSLTGARLQLHIVSADIQYPVAKLDTGTSARPAAQLASLTRLLASYCSNPVLFARLEQGNWQRIDGPEIWGCAAIPNDYRLVAVALFVLGMGLIISHVAETSSVFLRFSSALKLRERLGGQDVFDEQGPQELRELIASLNEYLSLERDRLEKRALVLSGVSHDLGTPATRLRLRTALIEDQALRGKLEIDIDQMTGMIESVLSYTRSEMNTEELRRISLTSLVQSIVSDYEDVGKPVSIRESDNLGVDRSRSVFGGGGGNVMLPQDDIRRVLVNARPISLRRAISNLIDNSLKYGRRATVYVRANSETASVIVEDEGTGVSVEVLNDLTGPFLRGSNVDHIEGSGLGLTIVSAIARQHGGSVSFEKISGGLRAVLSISRL